jgi:hypothetical protein
MSQSRLGNVLWGDLSGFGPFLHVLAATAPEGEELVVREVEGAPVSRRFQSRSTFQGEKRYKSH